MSAVGRPGPPSQRGPHLSPAPGWVDGPVPGDRSQRPPSLHDDGSAVVWRDGAGAGDAAPPHPSVIGWAFAGFALWFVLLCVLYAMHAMACDVAWAHGRILTWLALVLAVGLAIHGWTVARHPFGASRVPFARQVVGWSLMAAAVASALTLVPPLLLTPCGA